MNAITTQPETQANPLTVLRSQLESRAEEFRMVLPSHITPEKLQRTILTAVQANPDLLSCDRRSFLTSAFKAAQDGLLPDGREAALVQFNTRQKANGQWATVKLAQYMPMVFGLRKKILQSGEITDIFASVVYRQEIEAGLFIYEEGTERMLRHKPLLDPKFEPTDADIALVYSVATFKDGSKSFEVMRRSEINRVREASQTGATTDRNGQPREAKGPWVDWFSEMAKKTVIRRHSKSLPMSGDIFADVEAEDIAFASRSTVALLGTQPGGQPEAIEDQRADPPHDPDTGEIIDATSHDADAHGAQGPELEGEGDSGPASDDQATAEPETDEQTGITRTPGELKADEVISEVKAAISIMDVNSIESRSKADIAAMDDDVAAAVRQVIDARKAEIKEANAKAKADEAAEAAE